MGIFYFIYYTIIFLFLPLNQEDYKRAGGKFYPEVYLTPSDSLTWPINFEISIDVKDIKSLDISNESCYIRYWYSIRCENARMRLSTTRISEVRHIVD